MSDLREMNKEELFTYEFSATQDVVDLLRSVFRNAAKHGTTQADLARATGKHKSHINRILRGNIDGIQIGTVEALLRAMNHRMKLQAEDLTLLKEPQTNWTVESCLADIPMQHVVPSDNSAYLAEMTKPSPIKGLMNHQMEWDGS